MGWWKSENGVIGDQPADIFDAAIKQVENVYLTKMGRLPTQGELANLVEFTTGGALRPLCGNPDAAFTKCGAGDDEMPRASQRGRQGVCGQFAAPPKGKMANVNPATGEHYDASQASEVMMEQMKEAEEARGDVD